VARWCTRSKKARGEVIPLPLLWDLSKAWYHDRLSEDYRGRSAGQVNAIFAGLGLTSAFWRYAGDSLAPQK
jgi:hypothetical protein